MIVRLCVCLQNYHELNFSFCDRFVLYYDVSASGIMQINRISRKRGKIDNYALIIVLMLHAVINYQLLVSLLTFLLEFRQKSSQVLLLIQEIIAMRI